MKTNGLIFSWKQLRRFFAVLTILVAASAATPKSSGQTSRPASRLPEAVPGQYIVQLRAGVDPEAQAQSLAQQYGLSVGFIYRYAINGFSAVIPAQRLAQFRSDPSVLSVEPNLVVHATAQTLPTGVERIGATVNNYAHIDGQDQRVDVDVAVIDTGVYPHEDLNVYARTDCVDMSFLGLLVRAKCQDGQGLDGYGHGTHVAGTIGALDNDIGVVGVAPGVRVWSVRVLGDDGSGYLTWLIAGMDYVVQHAAEIEVANMSLGWTGNSTAARTAVQNAVQKGVVFVVAAGNDGQDIYGADGVFGTSDDFEPAAYPEAVTVSALADSDGQAGGLGASTSYGPDDTLATFSNYSHTVAPGNPVNSPGAGIDLAGPGVAILSTFPGGAYAVASGTSMATPHVTGSFALYIAANGRANTAAEVAAMRQAMINAAEAQTAWGPADTHDADGAREGLVNVATNSGPVNLAPVISINSPANAANFADGATIQFQGTATDEDGDLTAALSWTSNKDGYLGSGGSLSKTLSSGVHIITASATDSSGKTGNSSITLPVGCVPTQVIVSNVTYKLSKNKRDLSTIIELENDCGQPVSGATVSIELINLSLPKLWVGSGTTNQSGAATFVLKNAPAGFYQTLVYEIVAGSLSWDGETPDNNFSK
jgi:subtilisin